MSDATDKGDATDKSDAADTSGSEKAADAAIRPGGDAPDYRVEPVPKVPHRIGWRWAVSDIVRIVFLGGLLALVVVARRPCSNSVANFVETFDEADAAPAAGDPRQWKLERLTEEQIRQRFGADAGGVGEANDGGAAGADPGAAGADAGSAVKAAPPRPDGIPRR